MDSEDGVSFVKSCKGSAAWLRLARRRLPVLAWAPRYERSAAAADLVAGVTLGLTLVPQSIAYAALANLPVQYGLYSSFVGTMLYVALGTVREVSIGPTSLMALLTLQVCDGLPIEFVVLLTFLSGLVVLLMGLLRLGFLVDLISPSVTSGFTSAAAAIVMVAQLKGLLGLTFTAESLADNLQLIYAKWGDVRLPDVGLSSVCCVVLLLLRKLKDVRVGPKRPKLAKALWLISIGRNALVVLVASTVAYYVHNPEKPLFKLSGRVEPGLPRLALPPFSAVLDNSTVQFAGMVRQLGSGVVMLPVVMVLANIAIAKAFSNGGRVDATQEMLTLGLCNLAGSLVHAMPTCGALSRSAVSHSSGVRTPAAGFYSGIITLLALMFLTPYFYFIPKACLASVLVCAVIFMIDIPIIFRLWRRDRCEWCVLVLTLALGLAASVELAVLAGALASLAALLRAVLRPPLHVRALKTGRGAAWVVRPGLGLAYANAERAARRVRAVAARAAPRPVLLDCGALALLDYSAAQVLQRLLGTFKSADQKLIFFNANVDVVKKLENLKGIDPSTLRVATVAEALAIVEEKKTDIEETATLLNNEQEPPEANV